jgi:ornithine cyclodeaminase/alanine dehydrogenase-like protein (mu-crystallin family)
MKDSTIRFFSGSDIRSLLTMEDCIEGMKSAFSALSTGEAVMPVRTRLEMRPDNANALFMPVYMPKISRVGVKSLTNCIDNPGKGLPMIHALMTIFDSSTGVPLAVLDGEAITAMRTGAVSGLATSLLARKASRTAAIIGTGFQAETQLMAICAVREITKAYVFDLLTEKAEAFAVKMRGRLNIEVLVATSPAVLQEADVICTATPSQKPVFDDAFLKPGTHLNAVGAYKPDMVEIPPETIIRAKVVVDQRDGCLAEAGDILQPLEKKLITEDHIHGELGEVVTGRVAARENNEEITVFKSVGVAVQDLVSADLVLRKGLEKGVGTELSLA